MLISWIFPAWFYALLEHVDRIPRGYLQRQVIEYSPKVLLMVSQDGIQVNRDSVELCNFREAVIVCRRRWHISANKLFTIVERLYLSYQKVQLCINGSGLSDFNSAFLMSLLSFPSSLVGGQI